MIGGGVDNDDFDGDDAGIDDDDGADNKDIDGGNDSRGWEGVKGSWASGPFP